MTSRWNHAAGISIHALCEEGDAKESKATEAKKYFYPRPLRGGRRNWHGGKTSALHFYPRPLRGGRLLTRYTKPK